MRQITILVLITIFTSLLLAQNPRSTPPLLMDGHVHITNRVYDEGIDPWKAQRTGLWDSARARQGGTNVVIENIASYGYQDSKSFRSPLPRLTSRPPDREPRLRPFA